MNKFYEFYSMKMLKFGSIKYELNDYWQLKPPMRSARLANTIKTSIFKLDPIG